MLSELRRKRQQGNPVQYGKSLGGHRLERLCFVILGFPTHYVEGMVEV